MNLVFVRLTLYSANHCFELVKEVHVDGVQQSCGTGRLWQLADKRGKLAQEGMFGMAEI